MKNILTLLTALFFTTQLLAQSSASFWQDIQETAIELPENAQIDVQASHYRTLSLDFPALVSYLQAAPMELTPAAVSSPLLLELPMPDGSSARFQVWESPVMEAKLLQQFPMIRTFAGQGLDEKDIRIRFDYTLNGFHAAILKPGETIHIFPYSSGQTTYYTSFYLKNVSLETPAGSPAICGVTNENWDGTGFQLPAGTNAGFEQEGLRSGSSALVNMYTYRLAVATTAEYSAAHGNTPALVLSDVTTVINNVNVVFERDAAIRLILINSTTKVFFFGFGFQDPFTNGNTQELINENPGVLNDSLGLSAYDIGHVFGTNSGGLASTGSVCSGNNKGRGASGTFGPYTGNLFYIIAGHEIGHQFNALHSFNACDNENESPGTAYEPGSGSTIMCYNGNGVCGANHLQDTSDPYFHINAMERIRNFSRNNSTGGSCAEEIVVGNNTPEVDIPIQGGFRIPISTPFELTGEAIDPDGDDMTYVWEQYDLGPWSQLGMPTGTAPLFRSLPPGTSTTRTFPKMQTIVNNQTDIQEVLPFYSRPLTFRFTARDNNPLAGAYAFAEIAFEATENAGPFLVTSPNTAADSWEVGQYVEVTWDVANTDAAGVNCKNVNIRLSLDGGYTYPLTLLAGTPNDGSAFVVVPDEVTTQARVRVEAADNIFFDISNANFSIVPPSAPGFALVSSPEMGLACTPETFEITLETAALLGFAEDINFSVDGLPAGTDATFSSNPATPGETVVLSLDMAAVTDDGEFVVTITAEANGVDAAVRTVTLNVVYNDFSALALTLPAGGSGTSVLPDYAWTLLPNGLTYSIQVALDPGFTNIVDEATDLTDAAYTSSVTLEENTVYYWRVAVANECGQSGFTDPVAFKTVAQSCSSYIDNSTQPISASGLPLISSVVTVPSGGIISDVNVLNVSGNHNVFRHIVFRIIGPDGTSVSLMKQVLNCGSSNPFLLGFDDQSPLTSIPCPPTGGVLYKPDQPLAAFNGKDSQGDWTFQLEVVDALGDGGNFKGWELEVCGSFGGQDPFLVTNEAICYPPGGNQLIYTDFLEVDDADNSAEDLQFTILTAPAAGFLSLSGAQLGSGDHFTMKDIFSSQVEYTNTNSAAATDYFTFYVEDGNGGFLGTPRVDLFADANCLVSVKDILSANDFKVFPNPAGDVLTVSWDQQIGGVLTAAVYNVQGQLLFSREAAAITGSMQLTVNTLPQGMYLLQLTTEKGLVTKKVIVE